MARSCITRFFWANTFKVAVVERPAFFPSFFRAHAYTALNSLQQIDHPSPSLRLTRTRRRQRKRERERAMLSRNASNSRSFSIFRRDWREKRDGDTVLRVDGARRNARSHTFHTLSLSLSLVIIPDGTLHNTAVSVNSRVMRRRRGPA